VQVIDFVNAIFVQIFSFVNLFRVCGDFFFEIRYFWPPAATVLRFVGIRLEVIVLSV
jgi:hypothetical protein